MSNAVEWLDAQLPKPELQPPMLMVWLDPWLVVAWDGEILEVVKECEPCTVQQLTQRYRGLILSSAMLDMQMQD